MTGILPVTEKTYFCPDCQIYHHNDSKIGILHLAQSHRIILVNRGRKEKGLPPIRHTQDDLEWAMGYREKPN
jgi:hypothetical protein